MAMTFSDILLASELSLRMIGSVTMPRARNICCFNRRDIVQKRKQYLVTCAFVSVSEDGRGRSKMSIWIHTCSNIRSHIEHLVPCPFHVCGGPFLEKWLKWQMIIPSKWKMKVYFMDVVTEFPPTCFPFVLSFNIFY